MQVSVKLAISPQTLPVCTETSCFEMEKGNSPSPMVEVLAVKITHQHELVSLRFLLSVSHFGASFLTEKIQRQGKPCDGQASLGNCHVHLTPFKRCQIH
jgi:hypothetical protein